MSAAGADGRCVACALATEGLLVLESTVCDSGCSKDSVNYCSGVISTLASNTFCTSSVTGAATTTTGIGVSLKVVARVGVGAELVTCREGSAQLRCALSTGAKLIRSALVVAATTVGLLGLQLKGGEAACGACSETIDVARTFASIAGLTRTARISAASTGGGLEGIDTLGTTGQSEDGAGAHAFAVFALLLVVSNSVVTFESTLSTVVFVNLSVHTLVTTAGLACFAAGITASDLGGNTCA